MVIKTVDPLATCTEVSPRHSAWPRVKDFAVRPTVLTPQIRRSPGKTSASKLVAERTGQRP
ncbi:hypothetical protein [Nocardia nova]|uniref:hypothetical protein n=1 Tax=Nocardia nova TaxID=37330 RepID=UPI001ED9A643|nr:hypothetical protein [Nocardia nova]